MIAGSAWLPYPVKVEVTGGGFEPPSRPPEGEVTPRRYLGRVRMMDRGGTSHRRPERGFTPSRGDHPRLNRGADPGGFEPPLSPDTPGAPWRGPAAGSSAPEGGVTEAQRVSTSRRGTSRIPASNRARTGIRHGTSPLSSRGSEGSLPLSSGGGGRCISDRYLGRRVKPPSRQAVYPLSPLVPALLVRGYLFRDRSAAIDDGGVCGIGWQGHHDVDREPASDQTSSVGD